MAYEVPPLPYDYDALEPHIDEQTMQLHHDKHHQAYVDKANAALEGTERDGKPVEEVLQNLVVAARRQAGRRPQQRRRPLQPLAVLGVHGAGRRRRARRRPRRGDRPAFGSFDAFKEQFEATGVDQFGSGWAWLVHDGGGLAVVDDAQPGQPDHRRPDAAAGRRRLGARLLPEVPEPAPRLPRRVVERRQLGQGRRALRRRWLSRRGSAGSAPYPRPLRRARAATAPL